MVMYAEERHRFIVDLVARDGRAESSRLAAALEITGETLRRDLIALERKGLVRRTHGGVIQVERMAWEPAIPVREASMVEEKNRIAAAALHEVPHEGVVIIDSGTTAAALANAIPPGQRLTVVTNSLDVLNVLVPNDDLEVLMLGGLMWSRSNSSHDAWALDALSKVRVDVAFIGCLGITPEHGVSVMHQRESTVKSAMVRSARRVVVLADHTKVGNNYLHSFATLVDVDLIITDIDLDPDLVGDLQRAGPTVVTV